MKLTNQVLENMFKEWLDEAKIETRLNKGNIVWTTKDTGVEKGWLSFVNDAASKFERDVRKQITKINTVLFKAKYKSVVRLEDEVRVDFDKKELFLVSDFVDKETLSFLMDKKLIRK